MTVLEPMRDHWWWRPGWEVGRSFYTWHVTFADQPGAHQLVEDYAPALKDLPMFDPIPLRWIHLTTQGIGFTDEVDQSDIALLQRWRTSPRTFAAASAELTRLNRDG